MNSFEQFTSFAVELGCTELYDVVKTIEVVHNDELYRFEVVRNIRRPEKGFDVRILSGEGETWKKLNSAWIDRDSVEGALMQSMSYFFGRTQNKE
jgi:hypothetical protein